MVTEDLVVERLCVPRDLVDLFENVLHVGRSRVRQSIVPILYDYVQLRQLHFPVRPQSRGHTGYAAAEISMQEAEEYRRELSEE